MVSDEGRPAARPTLLEQMPDLSAVLLKFLNHIPEELGRLESSIQMRNSQLVSYYADRFSGTAAAYGYPELAAALKHLEAVAQEDDWSEAERSLRGVQNIVRPILEARYDRDLQKQAERIALQQGDLDLLMSMVEIFVDEYPRLLSRLSEAIAAQDGRSVERHSASLCRLLTTAAAAKANALAREIQDLGSRGEFAEAKERFPALERQLKRLQKSDDEFLPVGKLT